MNSQHGGELLEERLEEGEGIVGGEGVSLRGDDVSLCGEAPLWLGSSCRGSVFGVDPYCGEPQACNGVIALRFCVAAPGALGGLPRFPSVCHDVSYAPRERRRPRNREPHVRCGPGLLWRTSA